MSLKRFATVTKFGFRQPDGVAIMVMGNAINNVGEALRYTLHGVDDYQSRRSFFYLTLTELLSGAEMSRARSR